MFKDYNSTGVKQLQHVYRQVDVPTINRVDQDTFEHMQAKKLRFQEIYVKRNFTLPYDDYKMDFNAEGKLDAGGYPNWSTFHCSVMFDNEYWVYVEVQRALNSIVGRDCATLGGISKLFVFRLAKFMKLLAIEHPYLRDGHRLSSIRFDSMAFDVVQEHIKENRYAMNEALDKAKSGLYDC